MSGAPPPGPSYANPYGNVPIVGAATPGGVQQPVAGYQTAPYPTSGALTVPVNQLQPATDLAAAVARPDDLMNNFFPPVWAVHDYQFVQRPAIISGDQRLAMRQQPPVPYPQPVGSWPLVHPQIPPPQWPTQPPVARSQEQVNDAAAIDQWSHYNLPRPPPAKVEVMDAEDPLRRVSVNTPPPLPTTPPPSLPQASSAAVGPAVATPTAVTPPPIAPKPGNIALQPRASAPVTPTSAAAPSPVAGASSRAPSSSAAAAPIGLASPRGTVIGSSGLEIKSPTAASAGVTSPSSVSSSPSKRSGPQLPTGMKVADLQASVAKTQSTSLIAGKAASARALSKRTPQERVADALDGDWAPPVELLSIMVDDLYQDTDSQVHCCVSLKAAGWPPSSGGKPVAVPPVRTIKVLVILKYLLFHGPQSFFVHFNTHFRDVLQTMHQLGVDKKGQPAPPAQQSDALQLAIALRTFAISPAAKQAELRLEACADRLNATAATSQLVFFDWRHSPFATPPEPNRVIDLPDGVDEAKLSLAAADFPIRFTRISVPYDTTVLHQSYQSGLVLFAVQAPGDDIKEGVINPYSTRGYALICVSTQSHIAWRLPLDQRPQSAALHPSLALMVQTYEQLVGGATAAAITGRGHPYHSCSYPYVVYEYAGAVACYDLADRKPVKNSPQPAPLPWSSGGLAPVPTTPKAGQTPVVTATKIWLKWLQGAQVAMVTPTGGVWYWNVETSDKPKLRQEGKIALASDMANTFYITDAKDSVCIVGGVSKSDATAQPSMATVKAAAAGTERMTTRYHHQTQGFSKIGSRPPPVTVDVGEGYAWYGTISTGQTFVLTAKLDDSATRSSTGAPLPRSYILVARHTDGTMDNGKFYLPHGDSVFATVVDPQVDVLYILSRYGFLLVFRLPTLERWICESLPSLSYELALASPIGDQPYVNPCRLPARLDGITSIHLICDPTSATDSKGQPLPLPSHIQRGLVLSDGTRGLYRVALHIPIRSAAEDIDQKINDDLKVVEWRNLGMRSNALYDAVGKSKHTPSGILLDELVAAGQHNAALAYVFQDVSAKLRTDATIDKVGFDRYGDKAREWNVSLSIEETSFIAGRSPLPKIMQLYAAGSSRPNAHFLKALEDAHGNNPAAEEFLAKVARDVDSPIRVIQNEMKKWLVSAASSGVHPLMVAINYMYGRHVKVARRLGADPLPPPCFPSYDSQKFGVLIGELEYSTAPGADPGAAAAIIQRIHELMSSFILRGQLGQHTTGMTPTQRANTVFYISEIFIWWAHRENQRQRRQSGAIHVDEAIRQVLFYALRQIAVVDFECLIRIIFPLAMAFINGPDAMASLVPGAGTIVSSTGGTVTAAASGSGSITSGGSGTATVSSPSSITSGSGSGSVTVSPSLNMNFSTIKPTLAFMPTWLRCVYDLLGQVQAGERPAVVAHAKTDILSRLQAYGVSYPPVFALICQLCDEFAAKGDLRSVAILEPSFRNRDFTPLAGLPPSVWPWLLKLNIANAARASQETAPGTQSPAMTPAALGRWQEDLKRSPDEVDLWPIISYAGDSQQIERGLFAYRLAIARLKPHALAVSEATPGLQRAVTITVGTAAAYTATGQSWAFMLIAAMYMSVEAKTHPELWQVALSDKNHGVRERIAEQIIHSLYLPHPFWPIPQVEDHVVVTCNTLVKLMKANPQDTFYRHFLNQSVPIFDQMMWQPGHPVLSIKAHLQRLSMLCDTLMPGIPPRQQLVQAKFFKWRHADDELLEHAQANQYYCLAYLMFKHLNKDEKAYEVVFMVNNQYATAGWPLPLWVQQGLIEMKAWQDEITRAEQSQIRREIAEEERIDRERAEKAAAERRKVELAIAAEMDADAKRQFEEELLQKKEAERKKKLDADMKKSLVFHPDKQIFSDVGGDYVNWNAPLIAESIATGWQAPEDATCHTFWKSAQGWHRYEAKKCRVRLKKAPFAEGSFRAAYYMQDVTDPNQHLNLVGKQNKERHDNSYDYCVADLKTQLCAKFFVDDYMMTVKPPRNVDYVVPCIYELTRPELQDAEKWYFVEPRLDGEFERYTNNDNHVNNATATTSLLAFSHWTWQKSNRRMMVADLQGVRTMLADPQIHTVKAGSRDAMGGWGVGDCGAQGFERFFSAHHCSDICRNSGMAQHPTFRPAPGAAPTLRPGPLSGLCQACGVIMEINQAQLQSRHRGEGIWCATCQMRRSLVNCSQCRERITYVPHHTKRTPDRCMKPSCYDTSLTPEANMAFKEWRF